MKHKFDGLMKHLIAVNRFHRNYTSFRGLHSALLTWDTDRRLFPRVILCPYEISKMALEQRLKCRSRFSDKPPFETFGVSACSHCSLRLATKGRSGPFGITTGSLPLSLDGIGGSLSESFLSKVMPSGNPRRASRPVKEAIAQVSGARKRN